MAKLTIRTCEAARYEGNGRSRCVVWDDRLSGFGLRVYPTGRKAFVVHYRPSGERRKRLMTIGALGVLTVDQARERARRLLLDVRDGADPLAKRRQTAIETFGDLADRWVEEFAKPHRKSWKEDQRRIEKHLKPAFGNWQLGKITAADVRTLHSSLSATPVEANRVVELLRGIFNRARRWGFLPAAHANPAADVDRFRERSRERWLNARELTRLAAAINREADPWVQAAIRLLLLTGCRKTELLRARWDRVDLDGKRLLLEDTKTGDPKVVPLSVPALEILRGLPRRLHSPWVFPGASGKKPLQDLKGPWARIRRRAKLPHVRIHDLRRTTGSWLVQRGVPLKVVGEALGHRDMKATEVYARIAAQQPAEALEMLGEALSGAVRGRKRRQQHREVNG